MKKKIIAFLLTVLIILLSLTGCSSDGEDSYNVTVTGHVVEDYRTGLPVDGAKLYIDSIYKGTTNPYGAYQFTYSTTGRSTLRIEKYGYITQTLQITASSNKLILPDIRLMDRSEYSGSISGKIQLGNPLPANNTNSYKDVKVMATLKEQYQGRTVFWIYSDIADVNSTGDYYINYAKIDIPLTIIAIEDYDNDYFIEADEFFDHHTLNYPLNEDEHRTGIDLYMTPQ